VPTCARQGWGVAFGARRAPVPALIHPAFRDLPPPVILIGMHGSGTSIVSRILTSLGVYLGHDLDEHAEAGEFFALNEELLYRAGASWDFIGPYLSQVDSPWFRRMAELRLAAATFGQLRTGFLAGDTHTAPVWGWKDPRNSLTLPFWLRLFPDAKIIHVHREAEAAAVSIRRRSHTWAETPSVAPQARPASFASRALRLATDPLAVARFVSRRLGRGGAPRMADPCLDLDHCRKLAAGYQECCRRWRDGGSDLLVVRYEDLLGDPQRVSRVLAEFSGLYPDRKTLLDAAALVNPPALRRCRSQVAG
jgi:hypothetical protein